MGHLITCNTTGLELHTGRSARGWWATISVSFDILLQNSTSNLQLQNPQHLDTQEYHSSNKHENEHDQKEHNIKRSLSDSSSSSPPVTVWRANFYRIDAHSNAPTEYSCLSPTLTDPACFHVPSQFATLVLA